MNFHANTPNIRLKWWMNSSASLQIFDWIAFPLYFTMLFCLGCLGCVGYSKTRSLADYFIANRKCGKMLMIAHALDIETNTSQPVSVFGAFLSCGLSNIRYQVASFHDTGQLDGASLWPASSAFSSVTDFCYLAMLVSQSTVGQKKNTNKKSLSP